MKFDNWFYIYDTGKSINLSKVYQIYWNVGTRWENDDEKGMYYSTCLYFDLNPEQCLDSELEENNVIELIREDDRIRLAEQLMGKAAAYSLIKEDSCYNLPVNKESED